MSNYPPSETARKLCAELWKLRLKPIFEMPVYGTSFTVDIGFPDVKLYVEVNGPHHRTEEQASHDYRRDATLSERGWKKRAFTEKDIDRDAFACAKIIEADYLKLKSGGKVIVQNSRTQEKSHLHIILAAVVLLAAIAIIAQNIKFVGDAEPNSTIDANVKNMYSLVGTIEGLQERTARNGATFWTVTVAGKTYYVWDTNLGARLENGKTYQFTVEGGQFPRITSATVTETATANT